MYRQAQAAHYRRRRLPGIGILSDFYHMQIEEPDIAATLGISAAHALRSPR